MAYSQQAACGHSIGGTFCIALSVGTRKANYNYLQEEQYDFYYTSPALADLFNSATNFPTA